jgi:hypothetical protein
MDKSSDARLMSVEPSLLLLKDTHMSIQLEVVKIRNVQLTVKAASKTAVQLTRRFLTDRATESVASLLSK